MKYYEQPTVEICQLTQTEALAAVVLSEPTVEDNDLSV